MPNLTDRIPWFGGISLGTEINGNLPNISGYVSFHTGVGTTTYGTVFGTHGVFSPSSQTTNYSLASGNPDSNAYGAFTFDASSSSAVYSNAATLVYPAGVKMYLLINYR